MTIRRLTLLITLSAALFTAGCAGNADSGEPAGVPQPEASTAQPGTSAQPGASAQPGTSAQPESTALPRPTKGGPSEAGAQTISGTVTAGVEPSCLLLTSPGGSHLLVFDDPGLRSGAAVGAKVTVTGRADPAMMTTCQQGTPFIVTALKPAF